MGICMKMKLAVSLLYFLQAYIGIQGEYTSRYLGCYKDKNADRALSEYWYKNNNKNTIEYCLDFCSQGDYKYAGLEYAEECWCGNSGYNKHGRGDGCTYKCTGNENQKCGGWSTLSVYAITYLPEPVTTTTPSPTTSVPVPATSPTTTAPTKSLPATMGSGTTSSPMISVTAQTVSSTTTAAANSFPSTIKFDATTSPTNIAITTNTNMLPNTSTLVTNKPTVATDMRTSHTRDKRNRTTYIGAGVGAVVVCAIIVLVVVLVVRRRKGSDDRPRPTLTESPAAYENVVEINESTRQDEMPIAAETVKYVNVNLQQMVGSADGTGSDYLSIGSAANTTYTSVIAEKEKETHLYAALQ